MRISLTGDRQVTTKKGKQPTVANLRSDARQAAEALAQYEATLPDKTPDISAGAVASLLASMSEAVVQNIEKFHRRDDVRHWDWAHSLTTLTQYVTALENLCQAQLDQEAEPGKRAQNKVAKRIDELLEILRRHDEEPTWLAWDRVYRSEDGKARQDRRAYNDHEAARKAARCRHLRVSPRQLAKLDALQQASHVASEALKKAEWEQQLAESRQRRGAMALT